MDARPPPDHGLLSYFPPAAWLPGYDAAALHGDLVGGVTLAAYAIPVSLAYAGIAGLPPQVGVYGFLLGGLGYALFGGSRQLAIGPTSAISLMIGAMVPAMAEGDPHRYAELASLTGLAVALLCLLAWLLRLSRLVLLISDSILVGFKAGAAIAIALTQVPALLGIPGGGRIFLEKALRIVEQLGQTHALTLAVGLAALACLVIGDRLLPGKPVALAALVLSIITSTVFGAPALGIPTTGRIPAGLPDFALPSLRLRDIEGITPLAIGCLLLAYIEGISAAKALAAKHGDSLDPRQELLGVAAANLVTALGHGYPVAGGLSQSVVNDDAGARTPLALVFNAITLALCLLFLTGPLENLPTAVLSAVVLNSIRGLLDHRSLLRMWRVSRLDFNAAAIALASVLVLGILNGILLAALASVLMMLARVANPHVAFLGRIPGTNHYSDVARHPENEPLPGVIAFRPEAWLIYVGTEAVLNAVLARLRAGGPANVRLVICDLSASPLVDLAGARMLHQLHDALGAEGITLRIANAHDAVHDMLRADGVAREVGGVHRAFTLEALLADAVAPPAPAQST